MQFGLLSGWPHQGTLKKQIGGTHYQDMKIQPWDIWDACPWLTPYEANAIKYIIRRKPGNDKVTELQKAIHCLEHQIELLPQQAKEDDERRQKELYDKATKTQPIT